MIVEVRVQHNDEDSVCNCMTVKESYKHGYKFDLLFGLCLVVVVTYEFTCNHKGKISFCNMLEGSNSNQRYNLVRLELKRLFGELIICELVAFLKSLHDLIILCLIAT